MGTLNENPFKKDWGFSSHEGFAFIFPVSVHWGNFTASALGWGSDLLTTIFPSSGLPDFLSLLGCTEIGKKAWLFAKLQPGRARKRIIAT